MEKNFKGVIWTKHALERMRGRGIKQGDAWAAFRRSDKSERAKIKGAWVYYKTWGDQRIEVVAKPPARRAYGPEGKKWVILSVWSRPVYGKKSTKVEPLWQLISNKLFRREKK